MTEYRPQEKIYITSKTRMAAEARLRTTGIVFHVLLAWYSFLLIVVSLIGFSGTHQIYNSNLISTILSVGVFAMSLFTYGEGYSERAGEFKNCYLELQELYHSSIDIDKKMEKYADILRHYDNQSNADYDGMVVSAKLRGQKLQNAYGDIVVSNVTVMMVLLKKLGKMALTLTAFLFPLVLGLLLLHAVTPQN